MLIRVDDFPHGKEQQADMGGNPWGMLDAFCEALGQPFLLGCLFGPMGEADIERIGMQYPQIVMAAHGLWHTRDDARDIASLKRQLACVRPHTAFIPPYNFLDQGCVDALSEAGFRFVCTGPEMKPGLDFKHLTEIPSAFYGTAAGYLDPSKGKAEMFLGGKWQQIQTAAHALSDSDCLTLHLTWEANDGFNSLRELGKTLAGQVRDWRDFLPCTAGMKRSAHSFRKGGMAPDAAKRAAEGMRVHSCQTSTYEKFLTWVDFKGKTILDFGCGDSPFGNAILDMGATVWWDDRDTPLAKGHRGMPWDGTAGPVDVVVASNSAQHTREHSVLMGTLSSRLKPGGAFLLSEKIEPWGGSWWWDTRGDACWVRSLEDHMTTWAACGLRVIRLAFLRYSWKPNSKDETAEWVSSEQANQVIALLEKV